LLHRTRVAASGNRAVRCAVHELVRCGQTRLLLVQLLLTQHFLACAAACILQRSGFHQTGHSMGARPVESKPSIRCAGDQHSSFGLCNRWLADSLNSRCQNRCIAARGFVVSQILSRTGVGVAG
jgi:hypothetical protein